MSDVPPRNGDSVALSASSASSARARAPAAKEASKDVVLLGPPTADGGGVHVIRARDERIETGELRALQDGRPIVGDIVTLRPREANPRVCDVTESYSPKGAQLGHKGPANVASNAYREGWDEIFGEKPKAPGPAN